MRVPVGSSVTFPCSAEGSPSPSVFWSREGSRQLMFPGSVHGGISVSADGTLSMKGVSREDSSYFVCSALSVAGSATERALLEVRARSAIPTPGLAHASPNLLLYTVELTPIRLVQVLPLQQAPPPLIQLGPGNLTMPVEGVAVLPCQAAPPPGSEAAPHISWLKDGHPFSPSGSRVAMSSKGSLSIKSKCRQSPSSDQALRDIAGVRRERVLYTVLSSVADLQQSDSGEYTCRAESTTGTSSWSAWLSVVAGSAEARRGPDFTAMPTAPPKPVIVNATRDSLTVSWADPNPGRYDSGRSHLVGYMLDYFSSEDQAAGWVRAARHVEANVLTVSRTYH